MRNFVLAGRNTISSFTGISMKFKPWGAIKFVKGIGTAAAVIAVVIDILFISHFDYDHVSLIEHLKKSVKKIRFVVMPLLYDDERYYYVIYLSP